MGSSCGGLWGSWGASWVSALSRIRPLVLGSGCNGLEAPGNGSWDSCWR